MSRRIFQLHRHMQAVLVAFLFALSTAATHGQQVHVQTPLQSVGESFHERFGVGFGFNIRGGGRVVGLDPLGRPTANGDIQFRQGGFNAALPPFGGYVPGSDATLGFGIRGRGGDAFFNFAASQGSNRTFTSQSPSGVLPHGGSGMFMDATVTPFVTSLIPVVGSFSVPTPEFPMPPPSVSPLAGRIRQLQNQEDRSGTAVRQAPARVQDSPSRPSAAADSTAARGDISVAEIRRQQAIEDEAKLEQIRALIQRGRGLEDAGKPLVAKIYYQQAASQASGDLKRELLDKIQALSK